MLRGLSKLTWLEIKIFVREPLGVFGTVGIPVLVFLVLSRVFDRPLIRVAPTIARFVSVGIPVLTAVLIALSAVVSLVTIISIYREGGILKRLRATPLRPQTILTAHVLVKLLFTAITAALMAAAGRRYLTGNAEARLLSFSVALLFSTWSVLSIGFLIASVVPSARFAQPLASIILYPMIACSGLVVPVALLPPVLQAVAKVLPLTYAVSLLEGMWKGEAWSAHVGDVAALVVFFAICTAASAKVFRWE